MDELIDILNEDGTATGVSAMKSEAHQKGMFHATVHIWFYTKNGKILLQKRSLKKDVFPGLWDVSVAGHIGAGESILNSAIREVEEEIGVKVTEKALLKIGIFKSVQKHSDNLIDCEFHHTFLSELKLPLKNLTKQQSEVDDLALLPITKFQEELNGSNNAVKYVPHTHVYFTTIINEIKNLL